MSQKDIQIGVQESGSTRWSVRSLTPAAVKSPDTVFDPSKAALAMRAFFYFNFMVYVNDSEAESINECITLTLEINVL